MDFTVYVELRNIQTTYEILQSPREQHMYQIVQLQSNKNDTENFTLAAANYGVLSKYQITRFVKRSHYGKHGIEYISSNHKTDNTSNR